MDITFGDLRSREIINTFDGRRLGRALDIVFDKDSSKVLGLTVPGIMKFLRRSDDIFIPIEKITKIGDDVILVKLEPEDLISYLPNNKNKKENISANDGLRTNSLPKNNSANNQESYIRYKKAKTKF